MEVSIITRVPMILTLTLILAILLAGCAGIATAAVPTSQPPVDTTASRQTTALGTPSALAGAGVKTLLPAADIAGILGLQPAQYLESLTAADRKLGTCAFMADTSGSQFYLGIGVVIGEATIQSCNYRNPATPRAGSTLSTTVIRGATAYLDVQSGGESPAALQNIQLICIKDEVYYFLNTGFIPQDYAAKLLPALPALLDRLIGNTESLIQ
jgi:hypothetical protein